MAWEARVFKTNYNTIGAYVVDNDTGTHIYLKSVHELGIVHKERGSRICNGPFMSECLGCKHKLQMEANKIASMLNGFTDEVEVFD